MTQFATNTPLILTGSDSLLFGGWRRLGLAAALRKSFWPVTFWPICKGLGDCGGVSDVALQSVSLARPTRFAQGQTFGFVGCARICGSSPIPLPNFFGRDGDGFARLRLRQISLRARRAARVAHLGYCDQRYPAQRTHSRGVCRS